jgi:putative transposase
MQDDVKSLSHSKWRCKNHIVFAPKYRRQVIYGRIKADIGRILRELSQRKGVEILEAEACPDHIHMLVEIPPHMNVFCKTKIQKVAKKNTESCTVFSTQLRHPVW